METLITHDIYVLYTEGGNTHAMCHTVWDGSRFMQSKVKEVIEFNKSHINTKDWKHVEQITHEEFLERTRNVRST